MPALELSSYSILEKRLGALSPLDDVVYMGEACFSLDEREASKLRAELIIRTCEAYLDECPMYGSACEALGFDCDQLSVDRLSSLPQIPTALFKRRKIVSGADSSVSKWCLSSGTRGSISVVPRNDETLERLMASVRLAIDILGSWGEDQIEVVNLGPSQEEAGDVWFSYLLSLVETIYPTRHRVSDGVLQLRRAVDDILELLANGYHCEIGRAHV